MTIITIGISQLKQNFGKYMQSLKSGETIVVTLRGKPVAKFVPASPNLQDKLQSVVEAGLAEWNGKKVKPGKAAVSNPGNQQISDLVSHNRVI